MPCDDVTERLVLTLDAQERIESFSLSKNTCGAPVGNALLMVYVGGRPAEDLLNRRLPELVPEVNQARTLDQFLLTKQYHALRCCLEAYLGKAGAGTDDLFTIATLEFGETGTKIEGLLRVDLMVERIPACGHCGSRAVNGTSNTAGPKARPAC